MSWIKYIPQLVTIIIDLIRLLFASKIKPAKDDSDENIAEIEDHHEKFLREQAEIRKQQEEIDKALDLLETALREGITHLTTEQVEESRDEFDAQLREMRGDDDPHSDDETRREFERLLAEAKNEAKKKLQD